MTGGSCLVCCSKMSLTALTVSSTMMAADDGLKKQCAFSKHFLTSPELKVKNDWGHDANIHQSLD